MEHQENKHFSSDLHISALFKAVSWRFTHISDTVLPSLAARRHSRHCRDPPAPSRETFLKVSEGVRAYIPLCWWAWPAAGLGGTGDWPKDKSFSRVAQKESQDWQHCPAPRPVGGRVCSQVVGFLAPVIANGTASTK